MEITICTKLNCAPTATVDLPIKSWSEVKDWYVKWDTLHYTTGGDEAWREAYLNNDEIEAVNWEQPLHVSVTDSLTGENYYDDEAK